MGDAPVNPVMDCRAVHRIRDDSGERIRAVQPLVRLDRLDISMGATSQAECYQTGVILKQDYWELDGSYFLNGLRGLNATKTEEEL